MTLRLFEDGSKTASDASSSPSSPRSWIDTPATNGETVMGACMGTMVEHTEFVNGLDWCLFGTPGWCASVGWDERVIVWDARENMTGGRAMTLGLRQ